jgi:hypothetical protein
MTDLHPDVKIYINNLKRLFEAQPEAFERIFGGHDVEFALRMVQEISIKNFKKQGFPHLTKEQLIEVRNKMEEILVGHLYVKLQGFDEGYDYYCLN